LIKAEILLESILNRHNQCLLMMSTLEVHIRKMRLRRSSVGRNLL